MARVRWRDIFTLSALYVEEFYRTGLHRYANCKAHYAAMTAADLMADADRLMAPPLSTLPSYMVFYRLYALLKELIGHVGASPRFTPKKRLTIINKTVELKLFFLERFPDRSRRKVDKLLRAYCDEVKRAGDYPTAVDLVLTGTRANTPYRLVGEARMLSSLRH